MQKFSIYLMKKEVKSVFSSWKNLRRWVNTLFAKDTCYNADFLYFCIFISIYFTILHLRYSDHKVNFTLIKNPIYNFTVWRCSTEWSMIKIYLVRILDKVYEHWNDGTAYKIYPHVQSSAWQIRNVTDTVLSVFFKAILHRYCTKLPSNLTRPDGTDKIFP